MRLFEIDDPVTEPRDRYSALAKFIKTHCSPWLQRTNNGDLKVFRGTNLNAPDMKDVPGVERSLAFVRPIRVDRRPKDTEPDRSKIFDSMIQIAGGVANRSNSAFVTSNYNTAQSYTKSVNIYSGAHVFIPIGDFHYTWSPEWNDWTVSIRMPGIMKLLRRETLPPAVFSLFELRVEEQLTSARENLDASLREVERKKEWVSKSNLPGEPIDMYMVDYYQRRIAELSDPDPIKIEERFLNTMVWIYNRLPPTEKDEVAAIASDPNNFQKDQILAHIKCDTQLNDAIASYHEILISAKEGLYIDASDYTRLREWL